VLEGWRDQVTESFQFAIKASRRITHFKRLKDADDETGYLLRTVGSLGRGDPLPASPAREEGPRPARDVPGAAGRRPPGDVRVPPRLLARRRGPRVPPPARLRPVHLRHGRQAGVRDRLHGRLGVPAAPPGRLRRRSHASVAPADDRRRLAGRLRLLQARRRRLGPGHGGPDARAGARVHGVVRA
jgi:hypothetical protein